MDRVIVIAGQIPLETDILQSGQFSMVGNAATNAAVLGTPTSLSGFSIAPTSPASMSINIGPGTIFQQANLEATAFSSLPADTTHTIVKQGIALNTTTLTLTAPTTVGYAVSYLVQAQYQDVDTGSVVRPYYNAANPDVQFNGPGGAGTADNTIRKGAVALSINAGVAATSGSQVAPSPAAGTVGLYVITVAYGQTTITSGNIATYSGAPFIPVTLPNVPAGVQAGGWLYSVDQGSPGSLVAPLNPTPSALTPGMEIHVRSASAANGADTINVAGLGALPIKRRGGLIPAANDWVAGDIIGLRYLSGGAWQFTGLVSSDVVALISLLAPVYAPSPVLYVRPDGSDSNAGTSNTSASAFQTIAAAIAYGTRAYYYPGGQLTIQLGIAGTYAAPTSAIVSGAGSIIIRGNIGAQDTYVISGSGPSSGGGSILGAQTCNVVLAGVRVVNTSSNNATIGASNGATVSLQNVSVTANIAGNPFAHIYASSQSNISISAGCVISGSMGYLFLAGGGTIQMLNNLAISGTPTFSTAICVAQNLGAFITNASLFTISGSAAGARYIALMNGIVSTNGGGANFFPGTSAGSVQTGGQYA